MPELLANNAASTLSAAITSTTATTLTVTSAATFPTTGNFRILIDTELMLVTGVSGTTFTVTRGVESTTKATHLISAAVTHILTAAGLSAFVADNASSGPALVGVTASSFTAINGASLTDGTGQIVMNIPNTAGAILQAASYATAAETIMAIDPFMINAGGEYYRAFVGFTDGTQYLIASLGGNGTNWATMQVEEWTTDNQDSASAVFESNGLMTLPSPFWVKITNDGTNLTFFLGPDGVSWVQVYQQALASFMTPTAVVWGGLNYSSTAYPAILVRLLSFSQ